MRVELGTEKEALKSLPETFAPVAGEVELTVEQIKEAHRLILELLEKHPDAKFARIVL